MTGTDDPESKGAGVTIREDAPPVRRDPAPKKMSAAKALVPFMPVFDDVAGGDATAFEEEPPTAEVSMHEGMETPLATEGSTPRQGFDEIDPETLLPVAPLPAMQGTDPRPPTNPGLVPVVHADPVLKLPASEEELEEISVEPLTSAGAERLDPAAERRKAVALGLVIGAMLGLLLTAVFSSLLLD